MDFSSVSAGCSLHPTHSHSGLEPAAQRCFHSLSLTHSLPLTHSSISLCFLSFLYFPLQIFFLSTTALECLSLCTESFYPPHNFFLNNKKRHYIFSSIPMKTPRSMKSPFPVIVHSNPDISLSCGPQSSPLLSKAY